MLRTIARLSLVLAVAFAAFALQASLGSHAAVFAADPPPPNMRPGGSPPGPPPPVPGDTMTTERDSLMNVVLKSIAGRENMAAESVFKDIKIFKGMPAGRIPRIMNYGYGRSLGVGCKHCHVVGEWDKSDRKEKQVARDMSAMVGMINDSLLTKIKNLDSKRPSVNCTTCHRGQKIPAHNM